jgi:chaperonin GroES
MKKTTATSSKPSVKKSLNLGKPLMDRVLIKEAPAEERSAGGIIIPETAQEKPQRGEVVAVGRGKSLTEPTELKVGDNVLYGAYAGTEIKIKGIDYLIMREADILMVLPD